MFNITLQWAHQLPQQGTCVLSTVIGTLGGMLHMVQ